MNVKLYEEGLQMYLKGCQSLTQIAKTLGISRGRLGYYIKAQGYEIINRQNSSNIRSNIFHKIDTEEKAYWLGFLYADGYVQKENTYKNHNVELGLQAQDLCHLEKFKKFLNTRNKICYKEQTNSFKITINNKQLHSDLIQAGCVPNKSQVISFPSEEVVPSELIRHFVRGYVDGDGWIGQKKQKNSVVGRLGITSGSVEMLEQIVEKCGWSHTKIIKDERTTSTYNILWSNKNVINMLEFLYKDANIYLERKYNKYKELKNAVLNQDC